MTPKEKAEELFQRVLPFVQSSEYIEQIKYKCKQCALIAVDEIILYAQLEAAEKWWKEVKKELEKL